MLCFTFQHISYMLFFSQFRKYDHPPYTSASPVPKMLLGKSDFQALAMQS